MPGSVATVTRCTQILHCIKIHPVGAEFVHADVLIDTDEANSHPKFCECV